MRTEHAQTRVGTTEPCPTCGQVEDPAKRLHEIACCGLEGHQVGLGFRLLSLTYVLAHRWRDEAEYSAVESQREISEADALAWLERAHSGEVARRTYQGHLDIQCDRWED